MNLSQLKAGQSAIVTAVGGNGALRQHILDMGVTPGQPITVEKLAPLGDPMELIVRGYELTLRLSDAAKIEIKPLADFAAEQEPAEDDATQTQENAAITPAKKLHPGLGEEGKYHDKESSNPLPAGTALTIGLIGNQNAGKTTLFNQLTGANAHVGNFPGVTVDRTQGRLKSHLRTDVGSADITAVDLPGIYSMSAYSHDEIISRDFMLHEQPHAIINVIDATNVERSLYLTVQLLEMGVPTVIALNRMDEVTDNGGSIDINAMEAMLGAPVVPISASKNQGVRELTEHAVHVAHYRESPLRQDFCDEKDRGGAVHRCIHAVIHLIQDHAERANLPVQFAAGKAIEGDALILEKLALDQNEHEMLEHIVLQMEKECGLDRSAAMADMRFSFIEKVCRQTVKRPKETKQTTRTRTIDRLLTGKYTAIPAFIGIMGITFFLTFNVIGAWMQELLATGADAFTGWLDALLAAGDVNAAVRGVIIDGICTGVGSVLSFLPIIVVLFFFLAIMEDSGYIARVAFIMDKTLRKIGLSGRSIVPLLIGFGCSVPAIMSTRTLPSERDRRMTILLTPFMSCTAKLPIYGFFVQAFFPGKGGLIMTGLYLFGILCGILVAFLYKKTLFKGEAVPFVMELPNYCLPSMRSVMHLLWEKAKDFLQRAFSVILIAAVIIWFLQSFDWHLNMVTESQSSILAAIAGYFAPLLAPIGLADWRIVVALISGFMAKESVVVTLQVLYGAAGASAAGITACLSTASAASMLVFCLLYTPCVAAIASVRRELGCKWAAGVAVWQVVIAWIAALLVYTICCACGLG